MFSFRFGLLLLSVVCFLPITAFPQYDFRRGYVVTNNLDTIHGLIDYTDPESRSQLCVFKKQDTWETISFRPGELNSYSVSGSLFLSKPLSISDSLDYYFAEYLVDGIINLYFIQHKGRQYYFIERENEIFNLSNDLVEVNINGTSKYRHSNQYMGMLNWLMADADLREDIYNTKFNHKSLIDITKSYHNLVCDDQECLVYYKRKRKLLDTKWQINAGFSMGLMHTSVSLSTDFSKGPKVERFGKIYDQYSLISINKSLHANTLIINPGLYVQIDRNTRYLFSMGFYYQRKDFPAFEISHIQIPVLVDYDLTRYSKIVPFVSFGSGLNIRLVSNIKESTYVMEYGEVGHGRKTIDLEPGFIKDGILPIASLGIGIKTRQRNGGIFTFRMSSSYSYRKSDPKYNTAPHLSSRFHLFSQSVSLGYSLPLFTYLP